MEVSFMRNIYVTSMRMYVMSSNLKGDTCVFFLRYFFSYLLISVVIDNLFFCFLWYKSYFLLTLIMIIEYFYSILPHRKYIPKLKKFPDNYIYEPWKAPLSVQKAAGCIIGQDYPRPIVDHQKAREENLKRMGQAYQAGKWFVEVHGECGCC